MEFVLHSEHADLLRRRREWFVAMDEPHLALWWVSEGHVPAVDEAEERLLHLREHGPTPHAAFTPRLTFPPPD